MSESLRWHDVIEHMSPHFLSSPVVTPNPKQLIDTRRLAQVSLSLPMRPSASSALLLVAAASAVFGLEVHEPTYAVGVYAETRAYFAPKGYVVNGLVTVVDACPCDWTTSAENSSGSYDGLILVVVEGACTGEVECSAVEAACAAKQAEAMGILLPDGFGDGGGGRWKQVARISQGRLHASGCPWKPIAPASQPRTFRESAAHATPSAKATPAVT